GQLLLLDEPTSAMDVQARRNFWAQIHRYAARGRTVLFATHYLQEADDAADRVVVIAAGRKVADGPPGAIKARFGDRQVRFTLRDRPPRVLCALARVRALDPDGSRGPPHSAHPRVTLPSAAADATVAALVRSGLGWSDLDVGGLDLETSFLRLLGETA